MMTDTTAALDTDSPSVRLRRVGVEALSDAELLEMVLGFSRSTVDHDAARALLSAHNGLRGVARAGFGAVAREVGERRAARLVAALEMARRIAASALVRGVSYQSSRDIVRAYGPRLVDASEESVLAIVFDPRQRPIAERVIARGTATSCIVAARQVFALAVREGGAGVVLVHNHPSGDPTPSQEDMVFTHNVSEAGRLLELPLIDHVIVAREGSFSFLDAGLLSGR
jgi:DNA repair protein RadC